ncbi:MAG: ATP citrate synthase, partial [Thermoplasmatota archaeon]
MEPYILFSRDSRAIVFNMQTRAVQRMLDFDYLCQRDQPSVAAYITPTGTGYYTFFWGTKEIRIPRYRTLA